MTRSNADRRPLPLRALAAVALLAVAAGCNRFDLRAFPTPEGLFQASMRQFRAGHFDKSLSGFQKLTFDLGTNDSLYPLARFYLAESYFGQGDFVTAAREFRRVADESPSFRLAPTALLRAADSYAAQWTEPELDPTQGQTALATYQELQGRFPGSAAAQIAAARVRALNEEFASKEMANALFYYRRGAYDSAILYFKDLIASYPSSVLVPDAYTYLVRSYRTIGWRDEREAFCLQLRSYYAQYYAHHPEVKALCDDRTSGR
jgi:outer membrane protein assembly factor BamD